MVCKQLLRVSFVAAFLKLCLANEAYLATKGVSTELGDYHFEYLQRSNYLIGILEYIVNGTEDSLCVQDAITLLNGIKAREIWAIKLFDSYGHIPPSINTGNTHWYSPKWECDSLNIPSNIIFSPKIDRFTNPDFLYSTSHVKLLFQVVYARYKTPYQFETKIIPQTLHVGICAPQSCNAKEVLEATKNSFQSGRLDMQELLNLTIEPFQIRAPELTVDFLWQPSIGILGFLIAFVTILSILAYISRKKLISSDEETPHDNDILSYFDVRDNTANLFSADVPPGYIASIAGIKCLVCTLITVFHIGYFAMFTIIDSISIYASYFNIYLAPLYLTTFYVDTFFGLSGFLLCYQFLKSEEQMKKIEMNDLRSNVWLFVKTVLYRYCRLAPVYVFTILLSDISYTFVETASPYYLGPHHDLYCKKTWPYNLLFINNMLKMDDMCLIVGWYVACETQFFLLSLFLLFLYAKNPKSAEVIFVFLIGLFLATSYYCYYHAQTTLLLDGLYSSLDVVYTKPWTRINSYNGGVLMGWIMYEIRNYDIKIKRLYVRAYWICCSAFFVASLFMIVFYNIPLWLTATLNTFVRFFIGTISCSVIMMCHLGFGGGFNRFMSSKIFVHLSKLTYSIYLVTAAVVVFITGTRTAPSYVSIVEMISSLPSSLLCIYGASVLLYIFVELPFHKLSQRILK